MAYPLHSIAQVLTNEGRHVGMATLVQREEGILVTCAHVVRAALKSPGFDPHGTSPTNVTLRWVQRHREQAWATVLIDGWAANDESGGDFALLELRSPVPDESDGVELVAGVDVDGHRFHVYGAGEKDSAPVRSTGEIGGREGLGAAWRALHTDPKSRRIERGFSGAAVLDTDLQYVVGMVVAKERGGETNRSFFAPNDELVRLWPRLDRLIRSPFEISTDARQHWLPRARGVTSPTEHGWYFIGRDVAIDQITSAARHGHRGGRYFAVLGRPGTGKSSLLARIPVIADARLAQLARLRIDQVRLQGVTVFPVHLRQATVVDLFDRFSTFVGEPIGSIEGFLDALRRNRTLAQSQKILVLDGLDEAADEAARKKIARSISRIARDASLINMTVVVSCRTGVAGSENADLIATLGTGCVHIDVESTRYVQRADFRALVEHKLLDENASSPYLRQTQKVEKIAEVVTARAYPNYLVAQLVTRSLIEDPEISGEELEKRTFPSTVSEAFDDYFERFGEDEERARDLMSGLAHARGGGFAAGELWLRIAKIVSGREYDLLDLNWLLKSGASFLIETHKSDGRTRYRLYHQALVDILEGGKASAVYDECVDMARSTDNPDDLAYFREHLSGHAVAADRISDLLLSPEILLHCSIRAVLSDSSRTDVAISDSAQTARAALRSIQHEVDSGSEPERRAYIAMAGHQFNCRELATQKPSGPWWVHYASWKASSEHTVLKRGKPFTAVVYARIGDDDAAIAGDADGRIIFVLLDDSGEAIPEMQVLGSVTQLVAAQDDQNTFIAIGTDAGEVHLARVGADAIVSSRRVFRSGSPVVGLVLNCTRTHTELVTAFADGSLHLDVRNGLRPQRTRQIRFPEPIVGLTGLRGGRSTVLVANSESEFIMVRTEDLAIISAPRTEYDEPIYQVLDSWHDADQEASAIFSSPSGIFLIGLEFSRIRKLITRDDSSHFICAPVSRQFPRDLIGADGTLIAVYDSTGEVVSFLRGHSDNINGLSVVPHGDGTRILSVADDGSLRLWDASSPATAIGNREAVEILHVRIDPFQVLLTKDQQTWYLTREGLAPASAKSHNSARIPLDDSDAYFTKNASEHNQPMDDSSGGYIPGVEVDYLPFYDPMDVEPWASVDWIAEGPDGDVDYSLFVSNDALDVVRIVDNFPTRLRRVTPGVSEATGSAQAIAGYLIKNRVFFFVADGTYLRVFNEDLKLLCQIMIGGGPPTEIRVSIGRTEDGLRAAFCLVCESGLVAGEVDLEGATKT